jgi:restriction endonuclease S subunit
MADADWTPLPFAELAENVAERVDDPSQAGVDRYVGLEHLDPGSLSIHRWGSPSDVEATKLRFQPGDVIFGRRRAYQRKLARADFKGICSAHAMVLRARPQRMLPEFLPFLMQSDGFFERALSISVGSLSPTINWKALAREEFLVPPLHEQRQIAELLQACVTVTDSWQAVSHRMSRLVDATVSEFLDKLAEDVSRPLGEGLMEVKYGTSARCGAEQPDLVPVLRIPNVVGGHLDLQDLKWTRLTEPEIESYRVRAGDLLLVRTNGNPDYVARGTLVTSVPLEPMAFASYLLRLRVKSDLLRPEFLALVMRHPRTRRALVHLIRSSAGNYNLSATGLASLPVPMPSVEAQDALAERIKQLAADGDAVEAHARASQALYAAVREERLDGQSVH